MKIVTAGGGSGGHVTPVLVVINELRKHDSKLEVWFVSDRRFGRTARTIMEKAAVPVATKLIFAGKFRRYHRLPWWRQAIDVVTLGRNIRDLFSTGLGCLQSLWLLWRVRPNVVFTKGGFVCLPVGIAAALLKIPLVIHDSDAQPGLTNRILARWASTIATGAPLENYTYPAGRTHYVGIPVAETFKPVSAAQQQRCKAALGLHDTKKPLLMVTSGGLGARNINRAIVAIAPQLLPKTAILHITGQGTFEETISKAPEDIDYLAKAFITKGMAQAIAAADIVITRAGATTMVELAAMAKPVIIIPNPLLTGGHQLKNASVYEKAKAAVVIEEGELVANPLILKRAVEGLLVHKEKRAALSKALHQFAKPEAAVDTAALIVEAAVMHKHQQAAKG